MLYLYVLMLCMVYAFCRVFYLYFELKLILNFFLSLFYLCSLFLLLLQGSVWILQLIGMDVVYCNGALHVQLGNIKISWFLKFLEKGFFLLKILLGNHLHTSIAVFFFPLVADHNLL